MISCARTQTRVPELGDNDETQSIHKLARWAQGRQRFHFDQTTASSSKPQYSFGARFEEGIGTNPRELIAADHAGCFSMALSAAR